MTKSELIDEATRLGLAVDGSWTVARLQTAITAERERQAATGAPATHLETPGVPFAEGTAEAPTTSDDGDTESGDEPTLRDRAEAMGMIVPDSWTDEQVAEAIEVMEQVSGEAPPFASPAYEPASPRG